MRRNYCYGVRRPEESSLFRPTRRKKAIRISFLRQSGSRHISKEVEINLNAKDAICNAGNIHLGICILKDKRSHAAFSPSSGCAACHYDYKARARGAI